MFEVLKVYSGLRNVTFMLLFIMFFVRDVIFIMPSRSAEVVLSVTVLSFPWFVVSTMFTV